MIININFLRSFSVIIIFSLLSSFLKTSLITENLAALNKWLDDCVAFLHLIIIYPFIISLGLERPVCYSRHNNVFEIIKFLSVLLRTRAFNTNSIDITLLSCASPFHSEFYFRFHLGSETLGFDRELWKSYDSATWWIRERWNVAAVTGVNTSLKWGCLFQMAAENGIAYSWEREHMYKWPIRGLLLLL